MGNQCTVPRDTPLGCILPSGRNFDLKLFCNIAWPHYNIGKEEVWPINGTIKFILQLDLFSHSQWMEDEACLDQCVFSIHASSMTIRSVSFQSAVMILRNVSFPASKLRDNQL